MTGTPLPTNTELQAIILAAGDKSITPGGKSMVLQPLGDQIVMDYVVENARQLLAPEDIYIVVGHRQDEVRARLGEGYNYVVQDPLLGTGDAVLRTSGLLRDFPGNLLILHGDAPLFRPASVRGLINRHRLRKASLTLLSAVVARPLPYGRVVRDPVGQITDIIEETEAPQEVREIRELNMGAYVVNAAAIFSALETMPPAPAGGGLRLTDCVEHLIQSGLRVESYQSYDQDEVQGINTVEDLISKSEDEMIKVRNLGRKSLEEVVHKLAMIGLSLTSDENN